MLLILRLSRVIMRFQAFNLTKRLRTMNKKKPTSSQPSPQQESLVRVNFEVSENLRNAFKSKTAHQGKKVKDVLAEFMKDYVKGDRS